MQIQDAIIGSNGFCGPTAISALTGLDTDAVVALLLELRPFLRKNVGGMDACSMGAVLRHLGYRCTEPTSRSYKKPTLNQWIKDHEYSLTQTDTVYLIGTSDHWVVIQGQQYVCPFTKGKRVGLDDPRIQKRAKVAFAFVITKED